MNNTQALASLIGHLEASNKPVNIGWDEVTQWQGGLLKRFVSLGLLAKTVNTQSLECTGCEHNCFMDIVLTDDNKRAFIVCDKPDMQSQMGRIGVPLERLQQWQVSAKQFAVVITSFLKLDASPVYHENSASYKLGMLKSKNGRRWISLNTNPLSLEINQHKLPLEEILFFEDKQFVIDRHRINELLESKPLDRSKAYTPSTDIREASKLATQSKYQDWFDEYIMLQEKYPTKSKTWYSNQIAKMPIAQSADPETIRKHLR